MHWQITLDLDTAKPVTSAQVNRLLHALAEQSAAVSATGREVGITLSVEAASPAIAITRALNLVRDVLGKNAVTSIRGAEALTEPEADRRMAEPTIPNLVGASEAADILEVSRQRVHQLANEHAAFPSPVVHVRMGPLWTRASIEAFARAWERKSGRPKVVG